MPTSCSFISVLFPLFYALVSQTAFLPTNISYGGESRLGLHIVNTPGNPPTSVPPIRLSSRPIVLAFLAKGAPIPENEVIGTLVDADQAIADLSRDHPTERITNDRFEYRRPNGNTLISIGANVGEEITWSELTRILQALHRYMTGGVGTEGPHYQALEFEVEAGGQEKPNIGLGVVWYFKPVGSEVQKRATVPASISLMNEGDLQPPNVTFSAHPNETVPWLSNTAPILPGAQDVRETTTFPIPNTPLSLRFYFFGPSIPDRSVKATLQGAMAEVRPYLNGPSENDPIEDDVFRWILPLSREAGTPVAVTVLTYHGQKITWRKLFDVLFGLYAFTTTFGTELETTHYQILGFRILDETSSRLGVGTIAYFVTETSELEKSAETAHHGRSLGQPSAPSLSSFELGASTPIVYPVPNTPIVYPVANTAITLTFTFLGDTAIPPLEISGALNGARQTIARRVVNRPNKPIDDFKEMSDSGRVSMNILVYALKFITWREVDQILKGILSFCQEDEDHNRVLVFEIDTEPPGRGRVGFGTLLYLPPDPSSLEQRAPAGQGTSLRLTNSSISPKPSRTVLEMPIPYPIPGTPITLTLTTFGFPIPPIYVNAAFTSALRKIQNQVVHHPHLQIPNGRWERRGTIDKIVITVVVSQGGKISWQDLSYVLAALLRFMTEAGEHRCRDLAFHIDKVGEEATGYGSVVYHNRNDGALG